MKSETKDKLMMAWQWCNENDKSTEFMIEFMKDCARVSHDCVINFISKTTDNERDEWFKEHLKKKYKELIAKYSEYVGKSPII